MKKIENKYTILTFKSQSNSRFNYTVVQQEDEPEDMIQRETQKDKKMENM